MNERITVTRNQMGLIRMAVEHGFRESERGVDEMYVVDDTLETTIGTRR